MRIHRFLLLSVFFCLTLSAEIVEKHSLADVLPLLHEGTLLVCDLDNTIVHPERVTSGNHLASDQWFSTLCDVHIKSGKSASSAVNDLLPCYYFIMMQTTLAPIEPDAAKMIAQMQEIKGVHIVGLTARSFPLILSTINQLNQLGINFLKSCPFKNNLVIDIKDAAICKEGILFCGNNDKGAIVQAYCKDARLKPKKVIAIDDKLKNLQAIEKGCLSMGVPFVGIRYAAADQFVEQFDIDQAHEHLQEFVAQHLKKLGVQPKKHNYTFWLIGALALLCFSVGAYAIGRRVCSCRGR